MTEVTPTPLFTRRLKKLRKSYPNVRADMSPLIEQLQRGDSPGDRIQGVGYTVYKVRLANRDAQRGKGGGYRVIYYVRTGEHVYLLTVYSKSERTDISANEIRAIIDEIDL
jgi:mRNA-degrading endonuclease RelE of RelBE toxin-antitoxin system